MASGSDKWKRYNQYGRTSAKKRKGKNTYKPTEWKPGEAPF